MESPFIYLDPVIPPIFAGRKRELDLMHQALFQEKESLVIYGNDAIGKSSLVSTLYMHMNDKVGYKVFPVRINAFDFTSAIESNFLGTTTHQICAAIWTKLLKRNYSELIESAIGGSPNIGFTTPEEITINRIFRIVTSDSFKGTMKTNSELGGKFFIEGKMGHSNEIINERKSLAPFEFLHLLDELTDIIKNYGYKSILVFCDELNHFPEKTNTEILRNYFQVFSSQKIQFVLIVVNPDDAKKEDAFRIIESFNNKLSLEVFKNKEDVQELVVNVLKTADESMYFQEGAVDYLFTATKGHPWWVQKICDLTFLNTKQAKQQMLSLASVEASVVKFQPEMLIYNQRVAAGLPFRKSDLKFMNK